jgi:hypothetical protein
MAILTFFCSAQHQNNEYIQRYPHQPIHFRAHTILNDLPLLVRHQGEVDSAADFKDAETPHRDPFVPPEDWDEEAGGSN